MSQYDAVLISHSDCPCCSIAAVAFPRLRSIGAVSWDDDAQAFLDRAADEALSTASW